MEAMLGISLYSYLYLKLAKTLSLSYYLLCFLFDKIGYRRVEQVLPGRGGWGRRREEVAQAMYTHGDKCKNDKKDEILIIVLLKLFHQHFKNSIIYTLYIFC
jgi:hypothetical protein